MSIHEDEDYYVPLVDQRVFGANIKRKRMAFVPATSSEHASNNNSNVTKQNAGDRYLSIVLKNRSFPEGDVAREEFPENTASTSQDSTTPVSSLCSVCGQTITESCKGGRSHESSVAHQLCLEHSHPPSHLNRSHVGLKYLQGYGWDPDARTGLGARSEGIRIPIKAKEKNNSAGLGNDIDEEEATGVVGRSKTIKAQENTVKLNAKEVRKMETQKRERAEQLRKSVYGQDLSRYLGSDG